MRAKFRVVSIQRGLGSRYNADNRAYDPAVLWTINMQPVAKTDDPGDENSKFWSETPSGTIQLSTVNEEAVDSMTLGEEYYVDFTLAH